MSFDVDPHTHDRQCPRCPGAHGGPGPCDQVVYSATWLRFVAAHRPAFDSILYGDGQATQAERERLNREYETLGSIPRHICTCNPYHCTACSQLVAWCNGCEKLSLTQRKAGCEPCLALRAVPSKPEIGRTSPVHAPAPPADLIDVATGYAARSVRRAA